MSGERQPTVPHFDPLVRQLPRGRVILLAVVSPLVWFIAFVVASFVFGETNAIQFGLLIAGAAFALSVVVLVVLRAGRRREERRYVDSR